MQPQREWTEHGWETKDPHGATREALLEGTDIIERLQKERLMEYFRCSWAELHRDIPLAEWRYALDRLEVERNVHEQVEWKAELTRRVGATE